MTDKISVPLTGSQIDNLITFIECEFIDSVRDDTDIDNIEYIIDMMDALKTLRTALSSSQNKTNC